MQIKAWLGLAVLGMTVSSFMLSDTKQANKTAKYTTYLGCELNDAQPMSTADFLRLIAKPLCVKDSAGRLCKVQQFELSYAERGLYQDSTGLPMVVTEYSGTNCKGDSIPKAWQSIFTERAYKGDTVIIEQVIATSPDNKARLSKGLRIVLK